ncbi:MAG: glycosyltransferase [Candidatus Krumholzibacteria bacterium]|nr:glycosyltransferase [Candidatus Krumholzibacteria bacterium]
MNVCLVGPAHPYRGGIAHFTSMLAKSFAVEHRVDVINFRRLYPSFLFPGKTQYDDSTSPLAVPSRRIIDSMNPLTYLEAARWIERGRADLVVIQWWHPFFAPAFRVICSRVRRRTRSRIVFLCHNVLPHEPSPFDRALVRMGLGGGHAFLVQSGEDGRTLEALVAGAKVGFNPHPIYDWFDMKRYDADGARRALDVHGRVLLFFGLVRSYKGLSVLLRAFAACGERLGATLLVVGEFYEPRARYEELIAQLGIGERVRLVDRYVPNEEVEVYFKAADLVVLPYLTATQSGVVQIAFSFAKPVVVTGVGGLPDVVTDGETGYVVTPDDPEALAGAIERFFAENAAARMSAAIRADLDRFSWRRCVRALVELAREGDETA